MPHIKPKTCHKCGQMYIGWRCPHCYRKVNGASGGSRTTSLRTFSAASILGRIEAATIALQNPSVEYGDPRICRHCGFLTTTHPCTYCHKE